MTDTVPIAKKLFAVYLGGRAARCNTAAAAAAADHCHFAVQEPFRGQLGSNESLQLESARTTFGKEVYYGFKN